MSGQTNLLKRQSNFELLRIIAMFMVLVRHANFYALGMPEDIIPRGGEFPDYQLFLMSCLELFSGVGVNVFILISGYFGIRCKLKGAIRFIFYCLFYSVGIFTILYLCGIIDLSFLGLAECFFLRKINWFPKAYLGLFILAPVLNAFVEHSDEKQLRNTLIAFFVFQTIFGCISDATYFISFGYTTFSFIGLYLLARYIKLYPIKNLQSPTMRNFGCYVLISFGLSILAFFLILTGHYSAFYRLNAYCNPLVILSSGFLLMAFRNIKISSGIINKIALSCFAVYLVHSNPNVIEKFYIPTIRQIHLSSGFFELLVMFLFLVSVFIFSVIVDQVRIFLWNIVERTILKRWQI